MSEKSDRPSRRQFAQVTAAVGMGVLHATNRQAAAAPTVRPPSVSGGSGPSEVAPSRRRRYAIVGVGWRARTYEKAILDTHGAEVELVGVCDTNPGRLKLVQEVARKAGRAEPRAYAASDFDRMIAETKPDVVIVTTPDGFHHEYICRAMNLGCDVMTEKPMTIDAAKCQQILDTKAQTERRLQVMFNYRYMPSRTQVKELLMGGVVGDVLSVDFHWMLDTYHGADYFRRWHSNKKISGGLMLHKATHHFDLVNWWLSAVPVRVRASGKREFYTPETARRMGLQSHHERCHTCPEKSKCGFELDIEKDKELKALYLDNEKHDGYFRDRCVFRPDISIEDTMNVIVDYDSGATLSYSLNAFCGWEGYAVTFNGSKGRLEYKVEERVTTATAGDKVESTGRPFLGDDVYLRVFPLRRPAYQIAPRKAEGAHGGGDAVMLAEALTSTKGAARNDPTLRAADERSGAYSLLIGAAANRCFETGATVAIADLVKGLARPDYPKMPTRRDPVVMPPKKNLTDV